MGIPSYFSYIVKNHPNIIKKYNSGVFKINNLYLDCNSIIYDIYNKLDVTTIITASITSEIIKLVIAKIEHYIQIIKPNYCIYIAFDGVAPVAKLEQQRSRRYKSAYQSEMTREFYKKTTPDPWNTAAITPGTKFMYDLTISIKRHFAMSSTYNVQKIIVSSSDIPGEGEHKIFSYMRDNPEDHVASKTIVYGLDADLIMLSINHLHICPQIYLFRETPHFIQSIDSSLEPDEKYLLDIPDLANHISIFMNNDICMNKTAQKNRLYDYILLGFFLGNDFMPHFPALNIRTGGIDKLLNAYRAVIGNNGDTYLTDGKTIHWANLRKLLVFLAKLEEEYIIAEYKLRNKREHYKYPENTPEEMFKKFESLPTYERSIEHYINPTKNYWQTRYYRGLFNIISDSNGSHKKNICINYLEGLEWTMKYYSSGCPDWRWKYHYSYPPLLTDLIEHIPVFNTTFMINKPTNHVSSIVQLCYVLPRNSLDLLPPKLKVKLLELYPNWYKTDYEFLWSFCRYFWESHVLMDDIDIEEIESFIDIHKDLMLK